MQIVVSVAGIAIMVGAAALVSWYKKHRTTGTGAAAASREAGLRRGRRMTGAGRMPAGSGCCWPAPALAEDPAECQRGRCHSGRGRFSAADRSRGASPPSGSTCWWSAPARRSCRARTAPRTPIRRGCKQALAEKLPGVAVKVTTDVKPRRTAADMVTVAGRRPGRGQARAGDLADRHRGRHAGDRSGPIQRRRSIRASISPVPRAPTSFSSMPNTARARNR